MPGELERGRARLGLAVVVVGLVFHQIRNGFS